jgi:hypothetical protein
MRAGEEQLEHSMPPLRESHPELFACLERARHQISPHGLAKH